MRKGMKHPVVVQDNKPRQDAWASLISLKAELAMFKRALANGAVKVSMKFFFDRPKSHFGTGKNARTTKPGAPQWHTSKPDIDKLERCVLDAMTGIVFKDDSQVWSSAKVKLYTTPKGIVLINTNPQSEGVEVTAEWDEEV